MMSNLDPERQTNYEELLNLLADSRLSGWLTKAESRKILVRSFFYLFWWYYFPHYHQGRIPEYKIEQCNQAREPRVLIIDARDHGKSVVWSCGFPLWVMLTNPFNQPVDTLPGGAFRYCRGYEEIITQVSAAGALPEKWVRRHKWELTENKRLVQDWGFQPTFGLRDGIWASDEILLRNGAHDYSRGAGAQIRGDHPTRIVIDDLEDRERAQNPDQRRKTEQYFWGDLYGALGPFSHLVIAGTIVHDDSLLANLFRKEIKAPPGLEGNPIFNKPWKKFKYAAIKPDGNILAPEIWSFERLMLRKAELPPSIWRTEYMNQPESSENPIFPRSWFKPELAGYDPNDPDFIRSQSDAKLFSFVDPACEEGEANDYTAIITVSLAKLKGRPIIGVREIKNFRKSFRGQLTEALNTWVTWRGTIGFEAIQYQSMLGKEFGAICEEQHWSPDYYLTRYVEKKDSKEDPNPRALDKAGRAHRVTYMFELGWIKLNFADPMTEQLVEQLVGFTGDKRTGAAHDDMVDALIGCLWEIRRYLESKTKRQAPNLEVKYDLETGSPIILDVGRQKNDNYFNI